MTERPEAVINLRKAICIINEKLTRPVPEISDALIVVVSTLAHTEKTSGNLENWRVHMRGLKQMVRIRGGIEKFNDLRLVRNKVNRQVFPTQRNDMC